MSRSRRLNVFKPGSRTRHVGAQGELLIERLGDEGQGMAQWHGKRVFVDGALPGEQVSVRVDSESRHGLRASLLQRLGTPHADRVESRCRHYGECGGCQLQHLDYAAQVIHKQQVAQRRLHRQIDSHCWLEPVAAAPWRYRHRTRLQVQAAESGVQLGFLRQGSRQRVGIDDCLQWHPAVEQAVALLREALRHVNHAQRIDEVQLACGERDAIAVRFTVSRGFSAADLESLKAALAAQTWLLEVVEKASGKLVWSNERSALAYPGHSALKFGPGDFTQANPAINAAMVTAAVSWLAPDRHERVADFFAGLGNFSLPLAATGCTVKAYDIGSAMVARANGVSQSAGLGERLAFAEADLFNPTDIEALREEVAHCERMVLDPPRAGARALCERLADWVRTGQCAARRLVYVSCNSLALGTDLDLLVAAGFRVERAQVFDMFPHTSHFETAVLLVRD